MKRRIMSSLVAVMALTAVAATSWTSQPVRTDSGLVTGISENGALVFKGIPFAAPPVGDLRWRAPEPPRHWTGVKEADRFSPVCMQTGSYPPDAPAEPMSEDCLYLNVWAPLSPKKQKLPVMVWIYGGSLENGSASTPLYAGDRLVQKGVIVVTANYRLGVFGFLAHPDLSRESDHHTSGNYGLLDQVAALSWVHRNIAAFGGDPDRVTVFGQSSGSISISALTTSPLAKGLFQRAIGESGALFEPLDLFPAFQLAGAEKDGEAFVSRTGAASLEELRNRSATDLMKTQFDARLIIDGFVLTQLPYKAYENGEQNNVALLIGSNADEGQLFLAGRTITHQNFTRELERDFPDMLVQAIHPLSGVTDASARAAAAAFERDMRFRWDMWTWARLASRSGRNKVFFYQFSHVPPRMPGDKDSVPGASHGSEMPYVFGHLNQSTGAVTSLDRKLADDMTSYWTNFAKYGDPNGTDLPAWPAWNASSGGIMQFGDEIRADTLLDQDALRAIDRVYGSLRKPRNAPI
jgi:para-nitrobenzyl esterase